MTEADVEIVIQRARGQCPEATPRIISDNISQFIAKGFKKFVWVIGIKHVCTSPYYPQSNGKIERWQHTLKSECIRPGVILSLKDAPEVVEHYIVHYNCVRLNSAIEYVAPPAKLEGRHKSRFQERDRRLEAVGKHSRTGRLRVKLAQTKEEELLLVNLSRGIFHFRLKRNNLIFTIHREIDLENCPMTRFTVYKNPAT